MNANILLSDFNIRKTWDPAYIIKYIIYSKSIMIIDDILDKYGLVSNEYSLMKDGIIEERNFKYKKEL